MTLWHPHIWCETTYLKRRQPVRGTLELGGDARLDASLQADTAVWALEDMLAGGLWRSDWDGRRVVAITRERCCLCGTVRVRYEAYTHIEDAVLSAAETATWLDLIVQRYRGSRYNGVLWRYGMTLGAMEKRLNPMPSQFHNHIVYTGPA